MGRGAAADATGDLTSAAASLLPQASPPQARGAGFAKNTAVASSSGAWLCFLDADDTMHADRIERQYAMAMAHDRARRAALSDAATGQTAPPGRTTATNTATTTTTTTDLTTPATRTPPATGHVLIGSGFVRDPPGSTAHYTEWCNALTPAQLWLQQFREVTVIQPTWFLSREAFDRVGGYQVQRGRGTRKPIPSDLIFFQRHIDLGGALARVQAPLIKYRYVGKSSVSWNIPRKDLLRVRLRALERRVLRPWIARDAKTKKAAKAGGGGGGGGGFTLWGAGRDGKAVLNELGEEFVQHVRAFCDIDPNKIARGYHNPYRGLKLPVVSFEEAVPPVIVCVAMGRTGGALEHNIASKGWVEGVDYWHLI